MAVTENSNTFISKGNILQCAMDFDQEAPVVSLHHYIMEKMSLHSSTNRVAIVNGVTGIEYTYKQVMDEARHLAAALQTYYGLVKGQVVALALPNSEEFIVSFLAVLLCGGVISLVNPGSTIDELEYSVKVTNPVMWICSTAILDLLPPNTHAIYLSPDIKTGNFSNQKYRKESWAQVLNMAISKNLIEPVFDLAEDLATLPSSSGTTGFPKAVMLTHRNLVTLFHQYPVWSPQRDENDVTLGILPMFHELGLIMNLTALAVGSRLVILDKFSLSGFLQTIHQNKITVTTLVPPIVLLLSKLEVDHGKYDISSLRVVFLAAAPISAETIQSFEDKYSCRVMQAYGMTECTFATHINLTAIRMDKGSKGNEKPGSVGVVTPSFKVKIFDKKTGLALGPGEVGEICMQGPMVMKGYLNNPKATAEALDESGWLHSGDKGYYDEDGWFYIVGRYKELIKCRGYQVAPAELEHMILENPQVLDAAVIGIPHEIWGQVPKAFVVKRKGSSLTEKEVETFLHEKVSKYKYLHGGVQFVDVIPKTVTGKILRRELANFPSLSSLACENDKKETC